VVIQAEGHPIRQDLHRARCQSCLRHVPIANRCLDASLFVTELQGLQASPRKSKPGPWRPLETRLRARDVCGTAGFPPSTATALAMLLTLVRLRRSRVAQPEWIKAGAVEDANHKANCTWKLVPHSEADGQDIQPRLSSREVAGRP
jgi:hypothetical protein